MTHITDATPPWRVIIVGPASPGCTPLGGWPGWPGARSQ